MKIENKKPFMAEMILSEIFNFMKIKDKKPFMVEVILSEIFV